MNTADLKLLQWLREEECINFLVAMTKYHRRGCLNQRNALSHSSGPRCQQCCLLLRPLCLPCGWLSSSCFHMFFLPSSFLLFLHGHQPQLIRAHPHDLILPYLFKGAVSGYSRIVRYRGLGLQHVTLGGEDTVQPATSRQHRLPTTLCYGAGD